MKTLKIKATSGGVRGQAESGQFFDYEIDREAFIGLMGQVFDLSADASKADNKKSGGLVSQSLHAYGVTAEKLAGYEASETKAHPTVFPESGGAWSEANTEAWLEAMSLKKQREQKPLEERQKEWDAKAGTLIAAGLNPADFLSPKQRPVK